MFLAKLSLFSLANIVELLQMTQSGAVMEILLLFCLTLPLVYGAAVDPTPKQLYILQTDYFPAFCFVLENRLLGPDPDNPVFDLAITSFSAAP